MLDPNLDSYAYLFTDEARGTSRGSTPRGSLQMAAISQGMDPDHSFDMTSTELEDVKNYCIDQYGQQRLQHLGQLPGHVGRRAEGNVWATYAWPGRLRSVEGQGGREVHPPERRHARLGRGARAAGRTRPNYHHAHAFADAWAAATVGEKLISTWGYGHSNLDINLAKIDPDVVKVFGLDDPEKNLSEPLSYLDRYQAQRNTYNTRVEQK